MKVNQGGLDYFDAVEFEAVAGSYRELCEVDDKEALRRFVEARMATTLRRLNVRNLSCETHGDC